MKLVTLRTKPIEDPGEWCTNYDTGHFCELWDGGWLRCELGNCCTRDDDEQGYRRPRSCIDSAEEVSG